ncbi:hypothetical protein F3K36_31355 [Delftia sp. BR1]|nr:hypothetical protein F3K36_31355 [Delftia sp. BR1]
MSNGNPYPSPCPLCNQTTEAYSENYDHWTHYFCPSCREIKVSHLVINRLRAEPQELREQLSHQAAALRVGEYLRFGQAKGRGIQLEGQTAWHAEVRTRPV